MNDIVINSKLTDRKKFLLLFALARGCAHQERDVFNAHTLHMRDLLTKNQNGPEHGADGSFTEVQWTSARDALDVLCDLQARHESMENL